MRSRSLRRGEPRQPPRREPARRENHPPVSETVAEMRARAQAPAEPALAREPEPPRQAATEWGKWIAEAVEDFNQELAKVAETQPENLKLRAPIKRQQVINAVITRAIKDELIAEGYGAQQARAARDGEAMARAAANQFWDNEVELVPTAVGDYLANKMIELLPKEAARRWLEERNHEGRSGHPDAAFADAGIDIRERILEGAEAFYYVGMKLKEIKDEEYWKDEGFPSWNQYLLSERLEMTKSVALQYLKSATYRHSIGIRSENSGPPKSWTHGAFTEITRLKIEDAPRVAKKIESQAEKKGVKLTGAFVREIVDKELDRQPRQPKPEPPPRDDDHDDNGDGNVHRYLDKYTGEIEDASRAASGCS